MKQSVHTKYACLFLCLSVVVLLQLLVSDQYKKCQPVIALSSKEVMRENGASVDGLYKIEDIVDVNDQMSRISEISPNGLY